MDSILDKKNRTKPDWSQLPDIERQCQSCFEWFKTQSRWAKRCPACKKIDAPYRKQITQKTETPF